MREAVAVDGARVLEFVGSADVAVLLVSVHRLHAFSHALGVEMARTGDVALGTVDLRDVLLRGGPALPLLYDGLYRCGAPHAFGVLPGYCLFRAGRMRAWDAGLPALDDASDIARGALLGAVWWGLTRDVAFVRRAAQAAAEQAAARRVAARFQSAAAAPEPEEEAPREPSAPPADEVARAYQVLGVDPSVSDREVHEAWRRRQKENHPDHAAQDPVEFERRTRLSAEINRARDVILEHRGRGPRRAAGWS